MPNENRIYYVLCGDKCLFEGMTKEQIIAAIAEATGNVPSGVDNVFITKIKEQNANKQLKFWIGTTAEFNALASTVADTLYILSDDDTEESLENDIEELQDAVDDILDGTTPVANATSATNATNVTTKINGKNISTIFESNGTTVKNATNATNAGTASKLSPYNEFSGDASEGISIYVPKNQNSFLLITSEFLAGVTQKICFGLMWWDGSSTVTSPISNRISVTSKRYMAKITYDGDYDESTAMGSVELYQIDDNGNISAFTTSDCAINVFAFSNIINEP